MAVEVGEGSSVDLFRDADDELFAEGHQIVIVRVGLIELKHGELGVVARADALVAEVAVNLVDAIHAADYEPLEVELRRDAEEEIQIERVMVRSEWLSGGASSDLVHHGSFDFEVAATIEKLADGAEDGSAFDEDFTDVWCFWLRRRCRCFL